MLVLLRRLAGFSFLPVLSLIAPFLLLPVVARVGGVAGWAAIAIGQSLGALAAIVCTFGWTLLGPAKVAAAEEERRRTIYADSLICRSLLLLIIGPVACAGAVVLAPRTVWLESMLMALAIAVGCLSPAWYAIGVGRSGIIAKYELLPRLAGVLVAIGLILATRSLIVYPICLILSTVLGVAWFSSREAGWPTRQHLSIGRVARQMWIDRWGALTMVAAGAYSATPVAILGSVAPAEAVAGFSSAERLYRVALYAVQALGSSLQGWVGETRPTRVSKRMRASLVAHSILGLGGCVALAWLGVPAARWLFGDAVAPDAATVAMYGIAFFAVSVNTSTGRHMLIQLQRTKAALWSTVVGAVSGVACMFALGSMFGGAGAAAGLAIGELGVCGVQIAALALISRQTKAASPSGVQGSAGDVTGRI